MALQSSGQITLKNIATEFDDTAPHTLKEFYDAASGIPASGAITLKDFYGAQAIFDLGSEVTPTVINGENTLQEIVVSDYISSGELFQIPSDWWIWSDDTAKAALTIDIPCTILNYGKVIGRGGNGSYGNNSSGADGGPAIKINSGVSSVIITNYSGAYIAGGGGGGAGGGVGGGATDANASAIGGVAGAVNDSGSRGTSTNTGDPWRQTLRAGNGGGSGGGGGGTTSDYGGVYNGGGGGGGRILPGTGGASQPTGTEGIVTLGSAPGGGSANNNGDNGTRSGGGGGWGASGGGTGSYSGGAGGAAIDDSGVTYSFTNNGTVYGTT